MVGTGMDGPWASSCPMAPQWRALVRSCVISTDQQRMMCPPYPWEGGAVQGSASQRASGVQCVLMLSNSVLDATADPPPSNPKMEIMTPLIALWSKGKKSMNPSTSVASPNPH